MKARDSRRQARPARPDARRRASATSTPTRRCGGRRSTASGCAAALTKPALARVLDHARDVMVEALGEGGTSFDALYVNVNGASGYFDRSLHAYGQEGRPCRPVRHADPARGLHEPLVVLLPALPAPARGSAAA